MKAKIAQYFSSFLYFYSYLGWRIFLMIAFSIGVGVLDGFGLSMFLPLLQMVSQDTSAVDPTNLGKLRFLIESVEAAGFALSLGSILLFMLCFFILKGIAKFLGLAYRVVLQQKMIRKIRIGMLQALNQISFKAFVTTHAGRIQNTMTGEVDRVANAYSNYFAAFEQIILLFVYITFAFFVDAQFALLVCTGGLLTNFLVTVVYKKTKGASRKFTRYAHVYQGLIIQHIAHFKYLRATGTVGLFTSKLKDAIRQIEDSRQRIGVLNALLTAVREPIMILVVITVIMIQVSVLESPLAPILISLLFFYRALGALMVMQNAWNKYLGMAGSLENMQDFYSELQQNYEPAGNRPAGHFRPDIELNEVYFSYGDASVLKNINLHIAKNQTIAFVGESGSGKTTLVNLIAGLLQPEAGKIFIDQTDLKELDVSTYQKRIGYITQDPVIFNDTIFNNVTLWEPGTAENRTRFLKAIQKASLSDFIAVLPDQENTLLGNNGINLSGGQKQRIAIARELYRDIDILIMDEATSALDSETEKIIQANIDSLKGEYTIIIIAHRLSTIRNADCIYFIQNGKLMGAGNFDELSQKLHSFRKMVIAQEI